MKPPKISAVRRFGVMAPAGGRRDPPSSPHSRKHRSRQRYRDPARKRRSCFRFRALGAGLGGGPGPGAGWGWGQGWDQRRGLGLGGARAGWGGARDPAHRLPGAPWQRVARAEREPRLETGALIDFLFCPRPPNLVFLSAAPPTDLLTSFTTSSFTNHVFSFFPH